MRIRNVDNQSYVNKPTLTQAGLTQIVSFTYRIGLPRIPMSGQR